VPKTQPKLSLNVLCVDDDETIRQLLEDSLSHFKHRVTTANDGKHGLELFRTAGLRNDPFKVVISDLGMPEMDGHQLARAIKAESPFTSIIMLTGWGTMIKEDGIAMPEVAALLGKPPQLQKLNELVLKLAASAKAL
jgi:CheY-like chemotaxis protein